MVNARAAEFLYYEQMLVTPRLGGDETFRPVGHFYYFAMERLFGLRFAPYITGIHVLHLVNVVLIWFLARALGAAPWGAFAAALFYAFHAGAYQMYWQAMYIFDLLCATFVMASLLAYVRGDTLVSLVMFWLALKAKEVAIFLPVALVAYEWWLGEKRWRRLIPFFAISALLGIQALATNRHRDNNYTLRLTAGTVWQCARFYAAQLVAAPGRAFGWAGFGVLALLFVRNRMVRFGMLTFLAFLLVMLVLPGRLFGAYLYVPMIGLAIALSAVTRPVWLAVFFAVWIPWNYAQLREQRKAELAAADERRAWFEPAAAFVKSHPDVDTFVYDGAPESLNAWGVAGALRYTRPANADTRVVATDAPDLKNALAAPHLALMVWDPVFHRVIVNQRGADLSYIRLDLAPPLWQLGEGWIGSDRNFRWIAPHATARLHRPAGANFFEIVVYVPAVYIERMHEGRLDVSLDHKRIGSGILNQAQPIRFGFPIAPGAVGPVEVEFAVTPGLTDPSGAPAVFGTPVAGFGFK